VRLWPSVVYEWGTSAAERARDQPCDRYVEQPDEVVFRAVDVAAPAATLFRWLCQLRVAPYSYDWIDNLGRRSPRELISGLERLAPGQRFATIFKLAEFEPGRSITIVSEGTVFGRVAVTYNALELGPDRSRLLVKLVVAWPHGRLARTAMRLALAPGDLVMMRRQLLNFRRLAEGQAQGG
jgi:hypothetical protein